MRPLYTLAAWALCHGLMAQTTHTLLAGDMVFEPDTIVAQQGDSLHIVFSSPVHTFTQVDEATWLANGNTPSGQWNIGPEVAATTIALDASGTIHYVCVPHAAMGMKGVVQVQLDIGITDAPPPLREMLHPNPTDGVLWLRGTSPGGAVDLRFIDAAGREAHRVQVHGDRPVDVSGLAPGRYTVHALANDGRALFHQHLVRE